MRYDILLSSSRISNWRLFAPIHFTLDILALAAAWYASVEFRVVLNQWMPVQITAPQLRNLVPHPLTLLLLWIVAAMVTGIYKRKKMWSAAHALRRAFESNLIASALAIVATFFSRGASTEISRSFVFIFAFLSFFLLAVSFYAAMIITCSCQRRWSGPRRIAVLGEHKDVDTFLKSIERVPNGAVTLAGIIVPESTVASPRSLPVLGTMLQLAEVINREKLDQLICMNSVTRRDFELCGAISHRMGITFSQPLPPLWNNVRVEFSNEYGVDCLDSEPVLFTHGQELIKRTMDVISSSLLLILLSPLLVVLAIAIRLTSPGPIVYKSPRVGKGGRHFMFWKFRSMSAGGMRREDLLRQNEQRGHVFKIRNDPRITQLGRFMRRFSLDELPQLFNVLAGQMSLVGPRPLPAEDMDPDGLSREHALWAEERVQVRPGITGIWQVSGRSDLSFEQMVELDLEYVRSRSLALDIRILMETPLVVISGKGAY